MYTSNYTLFGKRTRSGRLVSSSGRDQFCWWCRYFGSCSRCSCCCRRCLSFCRWCFGRTDLNRCKNQGSYTNILSLVSWCCRYFGRCSCCSCCCRCRLVAGRRRHRLRCRDDRWRARWWLRAANARAHAACSDDGRGRLGFCRGFGRSRCLSATNEQSQLYH